MQILSFIERTTLSATQDPCANRFLARHKNVFRGLEICLEAINLTSNIEHTLMEFEMWSIRISAQKDSLSSCAIHGAPPPLPGELSMKKTHFRYSSAHE